MKFSYAFLLLALLIAVVAGNQDDTIVTGKCSGKSSYKLKLSEEDNDLEVELEVDMNKAKKLWSVTIMKDGKQVYKRKHRTNTASGSFEARTVVPGLEGMISAKAVSLATGEVCTIPPTKYTGPITTDDEDGDDYGED